MKVSELMGKEVIVVYPGDSVQKVCAEMGKHNHGLAVVLNNIHEKKVVGIVSNKDIINKLISKKISPKTKVVSDIMNKKVISLSSDKLTSEAMLIMIKQGIKRIIVIDNGSLQGIISSNDILIEMAKRKKQLLDMAIDF